MINDIGVVETFVFQEYSYGEIHNGFWICIVQNVDLVQITVLSGLRYFPEFWFKNYDFWSNWTKWT